MNQIEIALWKSHDEEIENCRTCPRLVHWRELIAREKRRAFRDQDYWGKPVPGFGDIHAKMVIIGLAPGAHGSNRTGRMFTGDSSGNFLYSGLYRYGFANQPAALSRGDGLQLHHTFITSICRCVPPANKPTKMEINQCKPYLEKELSMLLNKCLIVCLGKMAFEVVDKMYPLQADGKSLSRVFQHGAEYYINNSNLRLICAYHPSRQNTQTGRLTVEMGDNIWRRAYEIINEKNS